MANNSQYDWFRGNQNKDGKKPRKDQAKVVWKFTKIFLFFSLFFFSMWGCVQTFITKTDTKVGSGVELYSDKDSISPQVVTLNVTTDSAKDVYKVGVSNQNVFVNKKEDKATFTAIQDEFKTQGLSSLADANHGANVAYRFLINGQEHSFTLGKDKTTKGIAVINGKPLVMSTASKPEEYFKNHPWALHTASSTTTSFKTYNYNEKATSNKLTAVTTTINAPVAPAGKVLHESFIRVFNRAEIVKTLLSLEVKSGMTLQKYITDTATYLDSKTGSSATITDADKTKINNYNALIMDVYNVLGSFDRTKNTTFDFKNSSPVFGVDNKTMSKNTFIASWGQAFEMGRGSGPFFGIFVYPIAWVTNKLTDAMPMMHGWESLISISVVVIFVSIIVLLLSFKGTLMQTKMQELNAKKSTIDAKYEPYKGNKQMEMRKRQEVMDLYKKEGVSPSAQMATLFVTMPFFLAMWRVVGSIQHIKSTVWLGINFASTSYKELFAGQFQYLPLMLIAFGLQMFSQMYTRILTRKRDKNRTNVHQRELMKKNNKTQNIIMIVFGFITLMFSAGLQIYFIIRSIWKICEVQITHHILVSHKKKRLSKFAK